MDSGSSTSGLTKNIGKQHDFEVTVNSNIVFYLTTVVSVRVTFYMFEMVLYFLVGDVDGMTCFSDSQNIDHATFTTFCWAMSTYNIKEFWNETDVLKAPYPGIVGQKMVHPSTSVHFTSYPWFPVYLAFVSLSFAFMSDLWTRYFEGDHLAHFFAAANNIVMEEEAMIKLRNSFVDYLVVTRHRHKAYAYKFSLCEVLNMVHLCLQIWLADLVMYGGFSSYGIEVLSYYLDGDMDIMAGGNATINPTIKYFPLYTKCHIQAHGPSGSKQMYDGICFMTLHGMIEKIFVVLWFWYAFLFIVNTIGLLYRLAVLYIPPLRVLLLLAQSRRVHPKYIRTICKFSDYGDWYYIYSARNSVRTWVFDAILTDFGERLEALE